MGEACLTHVELVSVNARLLARVLVKHGIGILYYEIIYKDLAIVFKGDAL